MSFDVDWTETALVGLGRLEIFVQKRIVKKVDEFAFIGSFHGIRRLSGVDNVYRLRVGDYRVIFKFVDGIVKVLKVGHRKNVY